jgi:ABC-type phosphate/phosphonate transport system substrate-binding protein
MIATLPMYDWPEIRGATDAWWTGIARHLGTDVRLSRPADFTAAWRRPDLLLSQTCGYPFTHALKGRVKLVATPHYACDGCDGPRYCSIVLARDSKPLAAFRGAVAAVNTPDSMSGMLALKLVFAPFAEGGRFFSRAIATGGHLNSIAAVRQARADVCAVDAVCMGLARRHRPADLEGLVEIARSPLVPGLPYITVGGDAAALRQALSLAFADPDLREARDQLFLSGLSSLDPRDYGVITECETAMERAGGLKLL